MPNTNKARSSHDRSTERRAGVSMAEVVMDDMAMVNPAYPGSAMALLSLFPGIHIAHVPLPSNWELWRNSPDALQQSITLPKASSRLDEGIGTSVPLLRRTPDAVPGGAANGRWRCQQYDGIVATAVEHGLPVRG